MFPKPYQKSSSNFLSANFINSMDKITGNISNLKYLLGNISDKRIALRGLLWDMDKCQITIAASATAKGYV